MSVKLLPKSTPFHRSSLFPNTLCSLRQSESALASPSASAATKFARPLFSYSYESLSPQLLYSDIHPHCRGCGGAPCHTSSESHARACITPQGFWATRLFSVGCSLFALFCQLSFFVFNRLQPLSPKTGGWVYPQPAAIQFAVCPACSTLLRPGCSYRAA